MCPSLSLSLSLCRARAPSLCLFLRQHAAPSIHADVRTILNIDDVITQFTGPCPGPIVHSMGQPSQQYNGQLHPLLNTSIKGAIWLVHRLDGSLLYLAAPACISVTRTHAHRRPHKQTHTLTRAHARTHAHIHTLLTKHCIFFSFVSICSCFDGRCPKSI